MGVYAQVEFVIECKNAKAANKALAVLKDMHNKDENGNFNFGKIEQCGGILEGFHASGRVQNLEWQCEQMWKAIKDIPGVERADFPIVEEGNSMSFSNEEEE